MLDIISFILIINIIKEGERFSIPNYNTKIIGDQVEFHFLEKDLSELQCCHL